MEPSQESEESEFEVEIIEDYQAKKRNHNRRRKRRQRSESTHSDSPQPNKRRRLNIEDDEETESEDLDIDYDSDVIHISNNALSPSLSPCMGANMYIPPLNAAVLQEKLDDLVAKYLPLLPFTPDNDAASSSSIEQKNDTEIDALKLQLTCLKRENRKLKNKLEETTEKNG